MKITLMCWGFFDVEFGNDDNGVGLGGGHVIDISQPTF